MLLRLFQYGCFPIILFSAVVLHILLLEKGTSIPTATYGPILLVGLIVTVLEITHPKRTQWKAGIKDWFNEGAYMGIVQILLPKCLTYFFTVILLVHLKSFEFLFHELWPHHLSFFYQVILMLLLSELIHYWWHRMSHERLLLWRLHAVHHSVQKLHWINVGRFHILEKSCHYFLEALPFLILGVSIEVISLCYIFYAIIGFFQHSNINIKLGVLNYVFSGPELHRWHHSIKIHESNHNYGTNLIIWDLVFGTWYLPKNKEVTELGLINRSYPMSFTKQLKAPFVKGLDKAQS